MRAVVSGCVSAADYARFLTCQWRVHAPLEARVAERLARRPWVSGRLVKARWLAADLDALGRPTGPQARQVPVLDTEAKALGAMYVMEGATLGLAHVRRALPFAEPPVSAAQRFVSAYGAATGSLWSEFVDRLESVEADDWVEVCDGATESFKTFMQVFETA